MNISENTLSDVEKTICNKYNNSLMCELKQCNLLVNFTEYYPWVFSCNLIVVGPLFLHPSLTLTSKSNKTRLIYNGVTANLVDFG